MYDVIIIGGGPAGLMAANQLSKNINFILLEKNDTCGKKLLASGKGQCNITNSLPLQEWGSRFNKEGRYIKRALSFFSPQDTVRFFAEKGLVLQDRGDGKIFPESLKARDVLDCLLVDIRDKVRCNQGVKSIIPRAEGYQVVTEQETYQAKSVVVATGGQTYPSLGTKGDGYQFALDLGLQVTDLRPGLTPVYGGEDLESLAGYVLASYDHYRAGKKLTSYGGEVLITHKGLSGPGILDNSVNLLPGDQLYLHFCSEDQVEECLRSKKTLLNTLKTIVSEKLARFMLSQAGLREDGHAYELKKEERKLLVKLLCHYPFTIEALGDDQVAMVTAGGVSFKSIRAKNYEAKEAEGLFFIGEVTDVQGASGGFNIQAALSMGALVATTLNPRYYVSDK